jgi:hypothetical protein
VEAIVDFACNLVIVVSLVYFGIGLILELVERWKRLDPALLKSKAAPVQIPLALPESRAETIATEVRASPALNELSIDRPQPESAL